MSAVVKKEGENVKVPKTEEVNIHPARTFSYTPNPNNAHPIGKATLQQCLVVLNSPDSVHNQKKLLESGRWSKKDISCMLSLRNSEAWDPLSEILNEPFYVHTACGTVVDWAREYRSYPMLQLVFRDMLQQQKQIQAMKRTPSQVTMALFFGVQWYSNQQLNKTGTEEILSKLWRVQSLSKHFKVSFKEFWTRATHREKASNGLESGTRFLFGSMAGYSGGPVRYLTSLQIPTVNDLNFHNYMSNFGDILHRSQHAASLVRASRPEPGLFLQIYPLQLHLLLCYPDHRKPFYRRNSDPKMELDWIDILVQPADGVGKATGEKRLAGEAIILHILTYIDELVPFDSANLKTSGTPPHETIASSRSSTEVTAYVKTTITPPWDNLINLCDSYCLWMSPTIMKIRHSNQS